MKFSKLELHATHCLKHNLPLQVLMDIPVFPSPEMVVIPPENISKKMQYFKEIFDEDCKHKYDKGVSISEVVDFSEELTTEIKQGIGISSPLKPQLRKNHIRYEESYIVGANDRFILVEGRVEDVLKIMELANSKG